MHILRSYRSNKPEDILTELMCNVGMEGYG